MPENTELSVLDPSGEIVTLQSGLEVKVVDLKTRQFFRLLKIITKGAGPLLQSGALSDLQGLNSESSAAEYMGKLLGMILMALPYAEDEAVDFVVSMTEPVGLVEGRSLSDAQKKKNEDKWTEYAEALGYNPELEDMVTLIEAVVKREASDIQALGKRIVSMVKVFQKTQPEAQTEEVAPVKKSPRSKVSN